MSNMRWVRFLLLAILLTTAQSITSASADPVCKPGILFLYKPFDWCAETILEMNSPGIAAYSGMAFDTNGTLYIARTATGEIISLIPDSGKEPRIFASNLSEPPNGLAYDKTDNTFYVSGDTTITRLRDKDGDGTAEDVQIIARDLPGGSGGWLGNIRVGPDRRLYVAKASACDTCVESDPRRAALLSFALDGSDPRIVARGLRDSYDFDWNPANGKLYIIDNERPDQPAELNVIDQPGTPVDFGWPFCDAAGKPIKGIDGATLERCSQTTTPVATFAPASHPTGVGFYQGAAFPQLQGSLLVILGGSWNNPVLSGYELDSITFDASGKPTIRRVIPVSPRPTSDASMTRVSFYPYHLKGLAISPEGWLYMSVIEGRIYRFRPDPAGGK